MLTAGSKRRVETRWMVLNLESSKHLAEQKVQRKVPTKCLAEKMVVQRLMVVRLACLIHLAHPKVANLAEMKWKVQWKVHRMVASLAGWTVANLCLEHSILKVLNLAVERKGNGRLSIM